MTAVVVFGQSMMPLCDSLFEAIGKVSIYLRVVLAESAMEAVLTISFVVLGGGAVGAIAGRAAAFLFAAVVGLVLLFRTIGFGARSGRAAAATAAASSATARRCSWSTASSRCSAASTYC